MLKIRKRTQKVEIPCISKIVKWVTSGQMGRNFSICDILYSLYLGSRAWDLQNSCVYPTYLPLIYVG